MRKVEEKTGAVILGKEDKAISKAFFDKTLDMVKQFGQYDVAQELARLVYATQTIPIQQEFDDCAKILAINPIDVVIANISYDLTMATMGCTTIVGENNGKHWIGRNMDWFEPEIVKKATYIQKHPWGRSVSIFGQVGVVTGLSNYKFALIVNALPGGFNALGEPVLLALRQVLEKSKSYAQAKEMILEMNFMASGLVTLVGENKGELCVFELQQVHSRNIQAIIQKIPQDYPVVITNYNEQQQKDCPRFIQSKKLKPTFENVLATLSDNSVKQDITAQTILMNVGENILRVYV